MITLYMLRSKRVYYPISKTRLQRYILGMLLISLNFLHSPSTCSSHVGLPHIDCLLHDHMVKYEKAVYSSCHGLRYHLEGPCSHYVVLQLGVGARDVLRY